MTISGGAQLDGITQGDGSHLEGVTITLNSNAWLPVEIDDNDPNFRDNDGSQRLDQDVTLDGVTYTAGTRVEAEYSLTASYNGDTFTLVAFNVRNSSPAYGTVEGLAFIGGPGEFPPVGVPLQIDDAQEGPSFPATTYATPVCFAAGTLIAVPGGMLPVEALEVGQKVLTPDAGALPVRWVGQRTVPASGRFAPVVFAPGAIGNLRELRLSRQHRLRHRSWQSELMFGERDVLISAVHFVNGRDIRIEEGGTITYVHILFDTHQIVLAEGVEAESFHPSLRNIDGLTTAARAELLALFPELGAGGLYGPTVHPALTGREARALLAA